MSAPYHVYPTSTDLPDIAHKPEARLTRDRPEADCALCSEDRCWQEVQQGGALILHGTMAA